MRVDRDQDASSETLPTRRVPVLVAALALVSAGCGAAPAPVAAPPSAAPEGPTPEVVALVEPTDDAPAPTDAGTPAPADVDEPAPPDGTFRELWSRAPAGGWAEASIFLPSGDLASVSRSTLTIHARHDGTTLESAQICNVVGPRAITVLAGKLYLACGDRVVEVTVPGLQSSVKVRDVLGKRQGLFREAAFGGDAVVYTHNDGMTEVYSTTTWAKKWQAQLDKDTFAQHVAVSRDGRAITVTNDDAKKVQLFVDGKPAPLPNGMREVLAFSPDGARVFGSTGSFQAGELDRATGTVHPVMETGSWITAGVYFGDGMMAVAESSGLAVVRLADGEVQKLDAMTAETVAVNADGTMICGADRGDRLACYARGAVPPSAYKPADEAAQPAAPSKPSPSANANAKTHLGTFVGRSGARLTVKLASPVGIAKGARGNLHKRFEKKFGAFTASGWMGIAEVTVVGVKGSVVSLHLYRETSLITENGRKVNHFTNGAAIQLILQ
jgi:hypothetical protein